MWWHGLGDFLADAVGVPGGLALEIDGELHEIGGVGEQSLTLSGSNGMTILADLDGDGVVDHVTMHHFEGRYEVWSTQVPESWWGLPQTDSETVREAVEIPPGKGWEVGISDTQESLWKRVDRG